MDILLRSAASTGKKVILCWGLAFAIFTATYAFAAPKPNKSSSQQSVPPIPGTLINTRYVYVTSYDGDQFSPSLLPEDRQAIGTVQDAIQKWGKFIVVYEPRQADMVMMVMSRGSEDILAIYDGRLWPREQYLWRMTARGGLQSGETPLMTDFEKAFDQAAHK